jgi:hypothetical protein
MASQNMPMSKKQAKASLGKKGFSQLRKNEKQKQKARQVITNPQRVLHVLRWDNTQLVHL